MIGYNILPIGFSNYEKSTIETFFRLAGRRAPHWALTTRSSEARVVLFNATSENDLASFRSLVATWQKVIIVGNSDFGTGWPVLPRPIKLTAILALLDNVANVEASDIPKSPQSYPATVIDNPTMTDVFAGITTEVTPSVVAPSVVTKSVVTSIGVTKPAPSLISAQTVNTVEQTESLKQASVPLNEAPSFVASNSKIDKLAEPERLVSRVLLVDDSDIALKYMQNRLRHFSYECDMVHSGEEALAMVATHAYQFVFLDVMMAGLDGYQTCKAIKNNKARRGPAPVVVMLTSKGGTIDKIRGSMAGCDAYLTKPLNDKKLGVVLAKYDDSTVAQRWEASNPKQPLVDTHSPRNRLVK